MNNMKKMVVFVIVCAMMLSVAACGNTTPVGDELDQTFSKLQSRYVPES